MAMTITRHELERILHLSRNPDATVHPSYDANPGIGLGVVLEHRSDAYEFVAAAALVLGQERGLLLSQVTVPVDLAGSSIVLHFPSVKLED